MALPFFSLFFSLLSSCTFETPHACYSKSSKVAFSPLNLLLRLIEISRTHILLSSLPSKKHLLYLTVVYMKHLYAQKQEVMLPLTISFFTRIAQPFLVFVYDVQ